MCVTGLVRVALVDPSHLQILARDEIHRQAHIYNDVQAARLQNTDHRAEGERQNDDCEHVGGAR